MRIAVIGFGAGAIGFLNQFVGKLDYEIDIYEKGKDAVSSSLSGIRSDGKLIMSEENVSDLDIPMDIQRKARDIYTDFLKGDARLYGQDALTEYWSFQNEETYSKFFNQGFNPIRATYCHIGTDDLKILVPSIYEYFAKQPNMHFKFNHKVTAIKKVLVFGGPRRVVVECGEYKSIPEEYHKVVVCVGRSGYKLIEEMGDYNYRNGKQMVDIGVRFECPNMIVDWLNKDNYEWKVRYPTKTGYTGRTFCNNPSGKVVVENYRGVKTVNGHSNRVGDTDNTNFAILISSEFTEPFDEPNSFGESVAQTANQLAHGGVLLQTVGDFLNYKRTKRIGRVKPTLENGEYVLGDLNLAFPAKIRESIADFLMALGCVEPNILQADNLLYGAEVKFYSNKMNDADGIYFVGDCSGKTRNIVMATAHGYVTAKTIIDEQPKKSVFEQASEIVSKDVYILNRSQKIGFSGEEMIQLMQKAEAATQETHNEAGCRLVNEFSFPKDKQLQERIAKALKLLDEMENQDEGDEEDGK